MTGASARQFNPDELRNKYEQERDKRLRPDGIAQYTETAGHFRRFRSDDPYMARMERAPVKKSVEVILMGAGFGGIPGGLRMASI